MDRWIEKTWSHDGNRKIEGSPRRRGKRSEKACS